MGIVIVPALDRIVDPGIVSSAYWAWRLPVEVDRNDDSRRDGDDFHRFPCSIIDAILILIPDKDIMAGVAFVLIPIKKIVALWLIPTSIFSPYGSRAVSSQRERETILRFSVPTFYIVSFQERLQTL